MLCPQRHRVRGILAGLCLGLLCSAHLDLGAQRPAFAPSADEAAVRALVASFFAAYATKDLEGWTRLWSAKSEALAPRRQQIENLFAASEKVNVHNLLVRETKVEGEKASVRVAVEIQAVDRKTGQPAAGMGRVHRVLHCVKESSAWKVWREAPAEDELASVLLAASDDAERAATLLAADPELVNANLQDSLLRQGARLYQQGNFPQALAAYGAAQSVAERLGDQIGVAAALNHIGELYSSQGNYDGALDFHRKSLALSEASGNPAAIATALNHIGKVHSYQGDYDQSMDHFQKSLALRERLTDKAALGATLKNIGIIHRLRGNYSLALSYYSKTLPLLQSARDESGVAYLLNSIGLVHYYQGNYLRAAEHYRESLARLEALGEKEGTAYLFGNLGALHQNQGNYGLARAYYRKALDVYQAIEGRGKAADMLSNLGEVDSLEGNWAPALQNYRQSLALRGSAGDKNSIAYTLNNIGEAHFSQGNYAQASEHFEKSMTLRQEMGDRPGLAQTLNSMAVVREKQGEYGRALELAGRATAMAREMGSSEALWPALTTAARAERALNHPARARGALAEAIAAIESLRSQVAGGEQEQARFFEKKISPYQTMVELLIAENQAREAFTYAERAKARALLDVLQGGRVNISTSMTPSELERERKLKDELVSLNTQLSREKRQSPPDAARLEGVRARVEKARLDYQAFQTTLYAAHPELKVRRGEAQPITAAEARDVLPDRSHAALEYLVTEERTFLFVLTRSSEAADAAIEVKTYTFTLGQRELAERVERLRRRLANRDYAFQEPAAQLHELLVRPAQAQLQGKTTLLIVPDGPLWELPFQALRNPAGRYLIEDHAIFYAPSLTVLREMASVRRRRVRSASEGPTLLAVGNPTLGKQTVENVRFVLMGESLAPLPEAERQVKVLRQLYGPAHSKVYVGPEAREARVKAEAGKYRVIHLATHGILNDSSPMYSHVLLAQGDSPAGEDGLLEAWEIMKLDLRADLVVLSACETARGRVGAGEGVIGLTWALFVAGAPASVVSQWKVESRSTTELMVAFHRNLRPANAGMHPQISKAEALRRAALALLRSGRYRHPFFWAGFIVVGDGG